MLTSCGTYMGVHTNTTKHMSNDIFANKAKTELRHSCLKHLKNKDFIFDRLEP